MFWRLFSGYAALLLAAIGIIGLLLADRYHRHYQRQLNERLRSHALLAAEIARDIPPDKLDALHERIRSIGRDIAERITLIAADGSVLADSDEDPSHMENHGNRPEIQEARDRGYGSANRLSETVGKMMRYYALRIDFPSSPIRYARVALPLQDIEDQLAGLNRIIWTGAGGTAVAAMVLAFWLARRITFPLQELTAGVERISEGDLGHKVYAVAKDEVGDLARAFNHMSAQLAAQLAQVDEDRQQLRTILGSMVEGVVALDADARIVFANDRAGQLLDFRNSRVIGRRLWEIVRHRALQDLVRRAFEGPEDCEKEISVEGPVAKSLTVHAARLPGKPVRGVVLVLHDTSELRRLERLRQEFVANVSHELKTPLSVIKASVETLLDGAIEDPKHRMSFLEQIGEQADRLHFLILDLLSLARIESSAEVYDYEAVEVEPLIARCVERHRARAEAKGQKLQAVAPPAKTNGDGSAGTPVNLAAWADEEALSQILDNLVDNALKYTPPGGEIWVRWRPEPEYISLEVEDTGIGIPERDLPRIFERFYRVDKARSRELGGTGLGLSIVKHLAGAMRGTVGASSTIGKGSKFCVRLPRAGAVESVNAAG
jgi:two-component system phosphate regulon sensor histidine kinase PhoR